MKVALEVRKDERRDAPLRLSDPEVVVARGPNGRFYAAVVRTGYIQARARRKISASIQVNDCESSTEALEKLYEVSQTVLNIHRAHFTAPASGAAWTW